MSTPGQVIKAPPGMPGSGRLQAGGFPPGLGFRSYPLEPEEVAVCKANPLRILFLSSDGWISPCNYMGFPGRTEIPRRFQGNPLTAPRRTSYMLYGL